MRKAKGWCLVFVGFFAAALAGCFSGGGAEPVPAPKEVKFRVLARYPHDPRAFTQGLFYHDGQLYEGTGLQGFSTLRRVNVETGQVQKLVRLPDDVFGEGIALLGTRLFQITWLSGICYVYDSKTLEQLKTFHYSFPREGWGMTSNGQRLIVSDGSDRLYFFDPATFTPTGSLQVRDDRGPVSRLNELEYCQGKILANVWQRPIIVVIDSTTGRVSGRIDCTALVPPTLRSHGDYVLNGIAYDGQKKRYFVTGKMWPDLYAIELLE